MWQECDEKTVEAFVNGDNDAFNSIMELYKKPIQAYVTPFFKNDNAIDAEDIAQDVWLKAWEARTQLNKSFAGWLFSITKSVCINAKRGLQQEKKALDGYAEDKRFENIDPIEELTSDEDKAKMRSILHKLHPSLAECLRLRYYGHLNYEDLAAALDIPKGTVMSRLNKAHKKLKELW